MPRLLPARLVTLGLVASLLTGSLMAPDGVASASVRRLSSSSSPCVAAPLGVATPFNVFTIHNLTVRNSDIEGAAAAGGNVTLSGFAVGLGGKSPSYLYTGDLPQTAGIPDILIAGGNLDLSNGTVAYGNASYGCALTNNTNGTVPNSAHNAPILVTPPPVDFTSAAHDLGALSSSYAALTPAIQGKSAGGSVTLTGSDPALNIFTLSGGVLAGATSFTINAPSSSTVLVNIDGTSDRFAGMPVTLLGVPASHVLYNFYQATSLSIESIGILGSILAPGATVNFTNGLVVGSIVADTVSDPRNNTTGQVNDSSGQTNLPPFNGCLPSSSSPATGTPVATATVSLSGTATPISSATGTPVATATAGGTTTPGGTATVGAATASATAPATTVATSTSTPRPGATSQVLSLSHRKKAASTPVVPYIVRVVTQMRTRVATHTIVKHGSMKHTVVTRYRTVTRRVLAFRIKNLPKTGRFAGPLEQWHGRAPAAGARMSIARLNISWAPVWSRAYLANPDGSFSFNIVPFYGVTRFSQSTPFGRPGLTMLGGHDDIRGSIFHYLGKLHHGDAIRVWQGSHRYTYIVSSSHVVSPKDVGLVNATYARPTLALISCTPFWVDNNRIVVLATLQR